jgi:hypothetical protein
MRCDLATASKRPHAIAEGEDSGEVSQSLRLNIVAICRDVVVNGRAGLSHHTLV